MSTKSKTRHKAKVKAPATTSTALVKIQRAASSQIRRIEKAAAAMQVVRTSGDTLPANAIGEDTVIGALGLVEVKLSKHEEAVLNEQVAEKDILVKPTGQIYLSHPAYTKWFNRAFGRTGWSVVPAAKPMRSGNSVTCAYVLHIHGKPCAFAFGEQEYFENNKEQTFGDALEATIASALRRFAKRLGVGLELWDKAFCDDFLEKNAQKVWVDDPRGDSNKPRFRLKGSRPFWNERGRGDGDSDRGGQESSGGTRRGSSVPSDVRGAVSKERPAHYDGKADMVISDKQRSRLWAIISNSGRTEEEIKAWMLARYKIASSRNITRGIYEEVCTAIEAKGPLPMREPGEE